MQTVTISKDMSQTLEVDASDTTYVLNRGVDLEAAGRGVSEGGMFSGNSFLLNGTVSASGANGVALHSSGQETEISIGKSGRIEGDYGVYTAGTGAAVTNRGRIEAEQIAIEMEGEGSTLVNRGSIISHESYAYLALNTTGFTLVNDGKMLSKLGLRFDGDDLTLEFGEHSVVRAHNSVISLNSDMGNTSLLVNKGRIEATDTKSFLEAVIGGEANDTVRNYGTIQGNVRLGAGNDEFDDHGGSVSHGSVFGGKGSDTYSLTRRDTHVYELADEGYDDLSVKFSYTLADGNNIEEIRLSGEGNFKLVANDLGVGLEGNSGNNKLIGGAGKDAFYGGAGDDVLRGGADEDAFIFRPDYDREIVVDFEDGVDHIVLQGGSDVTSIDDLLANHLKDVKGGLLIFGDGTEMLLKGMDKAHFSAEDFTG